MAKTEIFGIDKKADDNDLKKKVKKTEPQGTAPAKKQDEKRKTAFFGD